MEGFGGHEQDWVTSPSPGLKCVICLAVAQQPQQHGECGKLFCSTCISEYKDRCLLMFPKCPHCRQYLETFTDGKSAQDIMALRVYCDNREHGCQWEGELYSISDHLRGCPHTLLPCPNQCESNQHLTQLQRQELANHISNECPRRLYTCPHCNEEGEYAERTTLHLDRCPRVTVTCPNPECSQEILRCQLEDHQTGCEYQRSRCKYARLGCETELPKRELVIHEREDMLHLEGVKNTLLELLGRVEGQEESLQNQLVRHQEMITSLSSAPRGKVFQLTRFKHYKQSEQPFYSPAFYSSPRGYRFRLSINAQGLESAQGTHLSVYAHLERGEYDQYLKWPFLGSIKIELLNQLEDKGHKSYSIRFPDDTEVSGRVVGVARGRGWGTTHFIAHKRLGLKTNRNCQYLKENRLVFRVSVEQHKPWLELTL